MADIFETIDGKSITRRRTLEVNNTYTLKQLRENKRQLIEEKDLAQQDKQMCIDSSNALIARLRADIDDINILINQCITLNVIET